MLSMLTRLDEITENFKESLKSKESELGKKLEKGDFIDFEKELKESFDDLANELTESMLDEASNSPELKKKAKQVAKVKRLQLRKTTVKIHIWTGKKIEITSYYGSPKINYTKKKSKRKRKRGPNGRGCHLLLAYWGFLSKASPSCYSQLGMLSVICPSFDITVKVLEEQGIKLNTMDWKSIG